MIPEQRIQALEKNNDRLVGLLSGLTAAVVTLINTHPDRPLVARLLEHSADFGAKAEALKGSAPEHLDFFNEILTTLHAVAAGVAPLDVAEARGIIEDVFRRASGGPAG